MEDWIISAEAQKGIRDWRKKALFLEEVTPMKYRPIMHSKNCDN
jgi:hypothetical protein